MVVGLDSCNYLTNYQAIKSLQDLILDDDVRTTVEGLVLLTAPQLYEQRRLPFTIKTIDYAYMIGVSAQMVEGFCEITASNFSDMMTDYQGIIQTLEEQIRRKRKGNPDMLSLSTRFLQKEPNDPSYLGVFLEQMLPKHYKVMGYGDGSKISRKRQNGILRDEYRFFCRVMQKVLKQKRRR